MSIFKNIIVIINQLPLVALKKAQILTLFWIFINSVDVGVTDIGPKKLNEFLFDTGEVQLSRNTQPYIYKGKSKSNTSQFITILCRFDHLLSSQISEQF